MKNKKILTYLAIVSIIGNLMSLSPVYAQRNYPVKENFFMSFFHKVMKKFGFEKDKNQGNKTDTPETKLTPPADSTPMPIPSGNLPKNGKNQKQQTDEERLTQLAKEGKITEAQKTAILAELKTLKEKYNLESLKDLTEEKRKAKMEDMMEELKAWAKEQGIDEKYVTMAPPMGNNGDPEGNGPQSQKRPPIPTNSE